MYISDDFFSYHLKISYVSMLFSWNIPPSPPPTESKWLFYHQPRLDAWDKRSDLVLWEDLEGVDGEGGGRRDRDGEGM